MMLSAKRKILIIPALIMLAGIVLCGCIMTVLMLNRAEKIKTETELNAKIYSGYLKSDLERGFAITNAVEQAVIGGNGRLSSFDTIAKNMMESYIQSIQIAPHGIVTRIYPAKGNEEGLGNLIDRQDLRGILSRYSRDHDVITTQGPFNLFQGGSAFAIRNPIFLEKDGKKNYWGMSIVLVKVPEIFEKTVNAISTLGYSYKLYKMVSPMDESYVEVYGSKESLPDEKLSYDFKVEDSVWRFEIASQKKLWAQLDIFFIAFSILCLFFILASASYFIVKRDRVINGYKRQALERNLHALENERKLLRQIQMYSVAMGVEYPLAIDLDYLNNHYQITQYEGFINKKAAKTGNIDDLIKVGASTIPDEKQALEFLSLFARDECIKAFQEGKKEIMLRHMQQGDDGLIHWVETKSICIECNEHAIHGIALSKCVDKEMQSEQLRIDAQRANRAKTSFLLRMSHDIRTPLNGIIGMIELARKYEDDKQRQAQCREKAGNAAHLLLELVNEVLDMGKLESGELILEHIPFTLKELIENCCVVMQQQSQERDVKLVCKDIDLKPHRLMGSPFHYKRIIMNILSNAIKYNKPQGSIYLSFKEEMLDDSKSMVEFVCRDTGIGIAPEFLKHIFEPFTQEKESLSARSQYGGSGLGMAIAKSITDKMGGTITIDSKKDVGTTVIIRIPFEVDPQVATVSQVELETTHYSIKDLNILLAEDNELNLEIIKQVLSDNGAHIIEAKNGQEVVDAYSQCKLFSVDAILMDIMMPVLDGYEATKMIRKMSRADAKLVPIIAMTASAFVEDRIAAKDAGMDEHLTKPINIELMIKTISNCVASFRQKSHA